MLYVPGSNSRMLEKAFASPADSVSYDLEDSVSPGKKAEARRIVAELLDGERRVKGEVMARINAVGTGFEQDDVDTILRTRHVEAIALPKTNHPDHLAWLVSRIKQLCPPEKQANGSNPLRIIGMIESAEAMVGIREIARAGEGHLNALLFAAEDYCADVGITRTAERTELLYPRSQLVTTAKAFGLQAIDLVCVDYKDEEALRRECEEGRRLGFDGKQAIHPAQVDIIHSAYSPSEAAVRHAARVQVSFEMNDRLGKGSYSLDGKMIDAPVYKQGLRVLLKARAAGMAIPEISEDDVKA
ncbi:Pyruvate/Phosphoenolpyruvate kinase-like domain-containing protein [Dioszegia hungarica]|uniref:Pyruvate/Phosphoenolpyruvate kinase-like domain-containing protein n=1 Tax=Dioszegia hungarica TaxID=4972 RepID=A0AA38LW98_9TREE|nr:Pyruvate/Phosphoenolpyruvate kinase-like domain-containing protein [Dioszegia hungarica]KAI9638637.1 Pyruvate/Phosphoenolpyruvate kinase-like domain-containing protein [Dioszegia hungarica]